MLKAVNRVLLGLAGLGLLALGGGVLIGGLDLQRRWDFAMPGWWFLTGPRDVVLGDQGRTRFRDEAWWWPTVFAVLGVLLLLLLWWLLAQVRRSRLGDVLVDRGDGAEARVRGRALEGVLAAEAESLDGVAGAHVLLRGRSTAPAVRAALRLEPRAEPVDALERLSGEALAHARASVGLDRLPAEVRLRAVRHRPQRVT